VDQPIKMTGDVSKKKARLRERSTRSRRRAGTVDRGQGKTMMRKDCREREEKELKKKEKLPTRIL